MRVWAMMGVMLLAGCAAQEAGDQAYCKRQGLMANTPAFAECLSGYERRQAAFEDDLIPCEAQAQAANPDAAKDRMHVRIGGIHVSRWGPYHDAHDKWDEPDYSEQYAVNRQRDEATLTCMQAKGWKGIKSWEEGRLR